MDWANMVGHLGVVCFLLAFYLLQREKITGTGAPYLLLNLSGAVLLLISLSVHWNFPAFLLEAAWALISIYGIVKHLVRKPRS